MRTLALIGLWLLTLAALGLIVAPLLNGCPIGFGPHACVGYQHQVAEAKFRAAYRAVMQGRPWQDGEKDWRAEMR